jgi:hypothetical protein
MYLRRIPNGLRNTAILMYLHSFKTVDKKQTLRKSKKTN